MKPVFVKMRIRAISQRHRLLIRYEVWSCSMENELRKMVKVMERALRGDFLGIRVDFLLQN